jgi:hypothetical protein
MHSRITRSLALVAAGFYLVACSKPAAPAAEPESPDKPATPEAPASAAPDTPVSSPVAEPAGSAPAADEIPKNCNFRVKGFCFESEQDACAAASCSAGKCMILESHPARIKCAD